MLPTITLRFSGVTYPVKVYNLLCLDDSNGCLLRNILNHCRLMTQGIQTRN